MVSLEINHLAKETLLLDVVNFVKNKEKTDVSSISKHFNSKGLNWNKNELAFIIEWALKNNYLIKESNGKICLGNNDYSEIETDFKLVLTIPPYSELGFKNLIRRNKMLTTNEAFVQLIDSSNEQIRITSPFVNSNLSRRNALPDFKGAINRALAKGCIIKLITRISESHPVSTVQWLIDFVEAQGFGNQLKVKYFHFDEGDYDNPTVITSIHSKVIISDNKSAYVGSAELKESKNFEVGCMFNGITVPSLVEAFDLMFENSQEV